MTTTHAVILAGGLGTRISSVLGEVPKALAPVGSKTFLQWKLSELFENGITTATFLLGHGSVAIREALSAHEACNQTTIDVEVALDGPTLLGTGGALAQHLESLPDAFYLTYGDNLLDLPYEALQERAAQTKLPCVLAVTHLIGAADRANCQVINGAVVRHDKTGAGEFTALDYGVMLLDRRSVEDAIAGLKGPFDLSRILGRLAERGQLAAAVTQMPYWEIGTAESLERLRAHVSHRERS